MKEGSLPNLICRLVSKLARAQPEPLSFDPAQAQATPQSRGEPVLQLLRAQTAPLGIDGCLQSQQGTALHRALPGGLKQAQIQEIGPAVPLAGAALLVGVVPDQGLPGQQGGQRPLPGLGVEDWRSAARRTGRGGKGRRAGAAELALKRRSCAAPMGARLRRLHCCP